MGDDTKTRKPHERPLDPTRDAEDILGDPSGRSGVTTGDPRQISAEPDEVPKDESVLPGGEIDDPTKVNPNGIAKDTEDDALYVKKAAAGMSGARAAINRDLASEGETENKVMDTVLTELEDEDTPARGTAGSDASQDPEKIPLDESGEETASGSAPDPEAIPADAGSLMAQYTGNDPDPDMDNPQEVSTDDVDIDEEANREK